MDKWIKEEHELYKHMKQIKSNDIPKWHWTKGTMSIISPSLVSNNMYELMKDGEISRHYDLDKAMQAANS